MARDVIEVQENSFSAVAQATEQTKRFSSAAEIANAAAPVAKLKRVGYVILPRRIAADKVAEIATEFSQLHNSDHACDTEFSGFQTRRLYNLVARTRVLDDLFLHPDVLATIEGLLDD